jgi:hypothetical protein
MMKQSKKLWRTLFFVVLLAALCGSFAFPVVSVPARAAPQMQTANDLVISEFRFRGSEGASDEFVEIFNPTASQVNLNGWKLNASNSSGTVGTRYTFSTDVFLQPGQHYLLSNIAVLDGVTADITYGTGITADGGIALLRPDNSIVDAVGLSAGSAYKEGTVLPSLTSDADRSYDRNADGSGSCIDTNNNASDFFLRNPSDPQNSSSPLTTCGNPTPMPTSTATATSPRSVIINEIAWSGTVASSTDEWFELYNNSGSDINLSGWQLLSDDGNPTINLSGIIRAGGYFVAARSAGTFRDLTVNLTYSSGTFENNPDAEILYLIDPNGNQVDTANLDGGAWNAGVGNPTYASMERQGTVADSPTAWATYGGTVAVAHDRNGNPIKGTPGQANWINTVTATPTATITGTATGTGTITNTPAPAGFHTVIINEIAWSGTRADSDDEWIELYNTTDRTIDLTNWFLKSDDNSPFISLTGYSIPARGFFLLARKAGTFRDVTPNLIYGDSGSAHNLVNGGEVLRLIGPSGSFVDTANSYFGYGFTKWAAGSASPNYASMERASFTLNSPAEWYTFAGTPFAHDRNNNLVNGTPGRANWAISVKATPSKVATAVLRTPTRPATPIPPPPLVAINEFVPRPGRDWNNDGVVNVGDEYIELLNHGTVDVNLSGYSLDDEVNIGSAPYRLPAVVLRPGERRVFYGSETGLLLSDGGDGVRLLKPNGQLMDAYNYFVVSHPDQSFCRLPDDGGADDWNRNCFPTPGLKNSLSGSAAPSPVGMDTELFCPIADTLPFEFALAECDPFGHDIWRPAFWDRTGWYHEKYLPKTNSKWPVFAD